MEGQGNDSKEMKISSLKINHWDYNTRNLYETEKIKEKKQATTSSVIQNAQNTSKLWAFGEGSICVLSVFS
jgi:hypothetical protein